jgi:O-antigen/teichoic acid export membrane protein
MKLFNKLFKSFFNNELLSKSSSTFIFKIIGSLLGYVFLLLVTRTSGAEVWGIFVLCLAVLNITSILSRFGVDTALLRFVAQLKGKMEEIKGIYLQGFSLVLALSIVFSILLYFFSNILAETVFQKPNLTPFLKVISFALIPFTIIHINAQAYRGLKRIKEFSFFQHTSKFLFAVIIFVLLFYFTDIDVIIMPIYSFLAAVFIVMIFSGVGIFKTFKGVQTIIIFTKKEILSTSYPMMLSSSILLLMAWADTIMIGIFKTEVDVGFYNVALKLAMLASIILGSVNSILAPKISETFNNNKIDEFKVLIKQSTSIIFFISLPILIVLFLFPEFLLSLFGQEFVIAKTTLLILLIGQAVNAMSGSVGLILQMTGKEKVYQNILLIALVFNIMLNLFLIPKFGIEGAAIASAFSFLFWNLSSVLYIYKRYKVSTLVTFK